MGRPDCRLHEVSMEAFKKPMSELDTAVYKLPFRQGEEQAHYAGFGAGIIFFTMSAYAWRPSIVGPDGATLIDPADFYPGCYARASVNPVANRQWKSIAMGLNTCRSFASAPPRWLDFGQGRFRFRPHRIGLSTALSGLAPALSRVAVIKRKAPF
jgi:Protein of unknown function (DUF2815)